MFARAGSSSRATSSAPPDARAIAAERARYDVHAAALATLDAALPHGLHGSFAPPLGGARFLPFGRGAPPYPPLPYCCCSHGRSAAPKPA